MKICHGALVVAAVLAAVAGGRALAQAPQPAHVVTYIAVAPSTGAQAETASLLRRVAAASRKEAGNLRYEPAL
jgi:hypothetical protein